MNKKILEYRCNPLERYIESCSDYGKDECKKTCRYAIDRRKREKDWKTKINY